MRAALVEHEPQPERHRYDGDGGGNRHQRTKRAPMPDWKVRGNLKWLRLISQRAKSLFELFDFRIDFTGAIPKVVVAHNFVLFTVPARYHITDPLPQATTRPSFRARVSPRDADLL